MGYRLCCGVCLVASVVCSVSGSPPGGWVEIWLQVKVGHVPLCSVSCATLWLRQGSLHVLIPKFENTPPPPLFVFMCLLFLFFFFCSRQLCHHVISDKAPSISKSSNLKKKTNRNLSKNTRASERLICHCKTQWFLKMCIKNIVKNNEFETCGSKTL